MRRSSAGSRRAARPTTKNVAGTRSRSSTSSSRSVMPAVGPSSKVSAASRSAAPCVTTGAKAALRGASIASYSANKPPTSSSRAERQARRPHVRSSFSRAAATVFLKRGGPNEAKSSTTFW